MCVSVRCLFFVFWFNIKNIEWVQHVWCYKIKRNHLLRLIQVVIQRDWMISAYGQWLLFLPCHVFISLNNLYTHIEYVVCKHTKSEIEIFDFAILWNACQEIFNWHKFLIKIIKNIGKCYIQILIVCLSFLLCHLNGSYSLSSSYTTNNINKIKLCF